MRDMNTRVFGDLEAVPPSKVETLLQDLQVTAVANDLIDVGYAFYDSPLGQLFLATTEQGLVKVAFAAQDPQAVLQDLATSISPRILRAPAQLDPVRRQLDEYFDRERTAFTVPLDRRLSHGFRQRVVEWLSNSGFGQTQTYAQIATTLDNPKAVRAVGSACATNPIPIIVPCHRVLRSDGSLGGYLGGLEAKQILLDLERPRHDTLL